MIAQLNNTAKLVLNDEQDLTVSNTKLKSITYRVIKRITDIIGGIFGCMLLLPVAIVIKIVTMCSGDFHSIFYHQKRIGKDGHPFNLYKFRSMVPRADEELKKLLESDKRLANEYKTMKKLDNDPRITKVGKFIRKFSIDELPQFINILFGQMTLVGNRPYLPREKNDMGNYYYDIIKTKPGLTGFWQVSLRSRGTFEQRLKMEKYYSNNCGLKFDIQILMKTINVVLSSKGAK